MWIVWVQHTDLWWKNLGGRDRERGMENLGCRTPSGGCLGGVSLVSMYQPWERLTHALLQFPSVHGKEAGVGKPKHEAVPSFFQWLIPHYPSALVSWCEPLWEPLGAQAGIPSHLSPTLQSRAPWLGLAQFHRSRARPGPNPTEPRAGPAPHTVLAVP